ncbi:MAG: membrane dipeptidase [Lachnospiraceae bacterium]|nr:membrane dipeptidase [Lachnospiraceae bacterium]
MLIDMHCDTLFELKRNPGQSLIENNLSIDIAKLHKGGYLLQNFAMFVHNSEGTDPYEACLELYEIFQKQMELGKSKIRPVTTVHEIEENQKEGLLSAMLTIEEGAVCRGETDILEEFYEKGVRMMTLTWNFENEIGFPNCIIDADGRRKPFENTEQGLKPAGFEMIEAMESMGMIVDVSHLSDAGFYDVAAKLRVPFAASHSNSREICPHPRNLTDEMLHILGEKGGVAGLNLYGAFVNPMLTSGEEECRREDLLKHVHHMADAGGIECVALGTDFDGFSGEGEIRTAADLADFPEYLHKSGFSWEEVDKITYKNVLRVYNEVLKQ